MHRSREAGRFQMDNHPSRPGDCGRYTANLETLTLWALCHKIAVYTDGRIILAGLIEVKDGAGGATAPRTIWEKKHADYITFAFDFALT